MHSTEDEPLLGTVRYSLDAGPISKPPSHSQRTGDSPTTLAPI